MGRAILAIGFCTLLASAAGGEEVKTTLTVGAAASLTDALTAIGRDYEAAQPGVAVEFRFGSSSLVARQIVEGAPAGLFFAANNRTMDWVADAGLLQPDTRCEVLSNRLVIITPQDRPITVETPRDILQSAVRRIAVCDPAVPVGGYTKAWLDKVGLYTAARLRFVTFSDVRAVLAAVDGGNAELGFVYQTDAAVAKASRTAFTVPETEGPPIRYPLAIVNRTAHPGAAAAFRAYLLGPEAAARYREFGFEVLPGTAPAAPASQPVQAAPMTAADVWRITTLSIRVALTATLVVLVPAVLLAYLLARCRFPGRNVVRTVVVLPMVLPPVATGFLLLLLLSRRGPVGEFLVETLGVRVVYTWWAAALAAAVVAFPLLVRSAEAAFAEVPDRLMNMAATLGSGTWRIFFTVALPLARRGVAYGLLFCFARSLGEFGATAVLAGIGRGTETLALGAWNNIINSHDTAALTLMAVSAGLAFAAMFVCETFLRPRRRVPTAEANR